MTHRFDAGFSTAQQTMTNVHTPVCARGLADIYGALFNLADTGRHARQVPLYRTVFPVDSSSDSRSAVPRQLVRSPGIGSALVAWSPISIPLRRAAESQPSNPWERFARLWQASGKHCANCYWHTTATGFLDRIDQMRFPDKVFGGEAIPVRAEYRRLAAHHRRSACFACAAQSVLCRTH